MALGPGGRPDPPRLRSLAEFIAYQDAGLVASFNGPDLASWTPYAVMAAGYASFEDGEAQMVLRDGSYGVSSVWLPLGRRRTTSVRVLVDGLTGVWELWARASYRGHRSAFHEFLGLFGVEESPGPGFDVDHLFARSRMRAVESGVVRLVLVDRGANRAWGGWLERLEVGWEARKPRHAARAVQVAKGLGLSPPLGAPAPRRAPSALQRTPAAWARPDDRRAGCQLHHGLPQGRDPSLARTPRHQRQP